MAHLFHLPGSCFATSMCKAVAACEKSEMDKVEAFHRAMLGGCSSPASGTIGRMTVPRCRPPPSIREARRSKLHPGDILAADKAPQIANAPFTLSCELTTAQRNAILIAHGGASTGYALHLSGGKLIWAIRHGKTLTTAQTDYPADNQPHRITATLGKKGQLTLQLDQNAPITATSPSLIRTQPKEDFCLGHDNKVPVATYTAKGKFEGNILRISISSK
ncbi:MAG: hypothetical protein CJBNEKGG_00358 [Prosthecobacter sp.]|nr:hypothetical protein [Prosthecobacter sp.]